MRTLSLIAFELRGQAKYGRLTQGALRKEAGVSRRMLTNVFSGASDYKVTTLLAISDHLGLELLLLPKAAAVGFADVSRTRAEPVVKTFVAEVLEGSHSKQPRLGL